MNHLPVAFLQNLGTPELLLILLLILVLFGARRLPDLARALGRSLGEFKKGREEGARADSRSGKAGAAPGERPEADGVTPAQDGFSITEKHNKQGEQ